MTQPKLKAILQKLLIEYHIERREWDSAGFSVTQGRTELNAKFVDHAYQQIIDLMLSGKEIIEVLTNYKTCKGEELIKVLSDSGCDKAIGEIYDLADALLKAQEEKRKGAR